MNVHDIMKRDYMILNLQAKTKEEALDEMIDQLVSAGVVEDKESFRKDIFAREETMSTGLGNEVAMPHAKNDSVKETAVVFAKSQEGVEFDSLDGQPAKLFFMIAAKGGSADTHLEVLGSLSSLLLDEDFITALKDASTPEQVESIVKLAEKSLSQEEKKEEIPEQSKSRPYVVAVTACPTGIAHTFMAADALKQKAADLNIDIKVETNGTDGVKNALTKEDIERADGVVVAVGKKVPMERFNGKRLVQAPVADGINRPGDLIDQSLSKKAPIYHGSSDSETELVKEPRKKGIGSELYKDLMNGISHMLPFVIAGGIILAISFLVEALVGSESQAFLSLNAVGGAAFHFLIPVLAGFIGHSIADRPGLVGGFAGGFLAVEANAGFLGGIAAGFLAGYVMVAIKKVLSNLPKTLDGVKTILLYPVLGLFITGLLMYFIVSPVFATINNAMIGFLNNLGTGNLLVLGAILGGMMAIDMGGPFNKAAYTFAIGVFTDTGNGAFMAAVMAGGMVPPLAIATASLLFPKKFTNRERQSGLTNFIMGLSFITEGAIPFAAADPLRVLSSCIIGSAITGGLTQFWLTSIPAPHGGIFTIATLGQNRLMLLLAIAIGTLISALILGLWKPKVEEAPEVEKS